MCEILPKSPKGGPKVEEGSSKTVSRTRPGGLLRKIGTVYFFQKDANTEYNSVSRFCPSSIAPATLLEVGANLVKNPNIAKV